LSPTSMVILSSILALGLFWSSNPYVDFSSVWFASSSVGPWWLCRSRGAGSSVCLSTLLFPCFELLELGGGRLMVFSLYANELRLLLELNMPCLLVYIW